MRRYSLYKYHRCSGQRGKNRGVHTKAASCPYSSLHVLDVAHAEGCKRPDAFTIATSRRHLAFPAVRKKAAAIGVATSFLTAYPVLAFVRRDDGHASVNGHKRGLRVFPRFRSVRAVRLVLTARAHRTRRPLPPFRNTQRSASQNSVCTTTLKQHACSLCQAGYARGISPAHARTTFHHYTVRRLSEYRHLKGTEKDNRRRARRKARGGECSSGRQKHPPAKACAQSFDLRAASFLHTLAEQSVTESTACIS